MPQINVVDLLFDTFIAGEQFQVIRRSDNVGTNGETTISAAPLCGVGQITPTGDNSMLREEAFTAGQNTIQVITAFMLRGPSRDGWTGQNFQPDIVVWKGGKYIVRVLSDYSQYGAGMVVAECSSIDYVENATTVC
jgi:hypothetical protein